MADQEDLNEPELMSIEGSEIEAAIDLHSIGMDGVCRPLHINQCSEDLLSLTLDDAERLYNFLSVAIPYIKGVKDARLTPH